jgi:hypothetical protein
MIFDCRDYHQLSLFEIGGQKRISQHLFALERLGAYDERCSQMPWLETSRLFESLHSDPRFQAPVERVRYYPSWQVRGKQPTCAFEPGPVAASRTPVQIGEYVARLGVVSARGIGEG